MITGSPEEQSPEAITRLSIRTGAAGYQPSGAVSGDDCFFNLAPGVSLGEATDAIEATAGQTGMPQHPEQLSGNRPGIPGGPGE